MNNDLTVGKPSSVLLKFIIPLLGSVIFQQLYNIADSFVAGKFIGETALAAVGNSFEITLIFIAVAVGSNIGCSVLISQLFGSKKYSDMKTAVYTSFISVFVVCFTLMLFGFLFCDKMLYAINTPENIFYDSKLYLYIYILGVPFMMFYNISNGIFSALGDSKTPFIFLALSSTTNVLVNIIFVTVFKMGVSGVAWATFLCQGISAILAVLVIFNRLKKIKTEEKVRKFSKDMLFRISKIAIPSILQQSFISIGNIVVQGVINTFDVAVIAGYSAAMKLNTFAITSFMTVGNGISSFTAQNFGAKRRERINDGLRAGIKISWTLCVPFVIIYFMLGKVILNLFIDNPTLLAVSTGMDILKILPPFYFVISLKLAVDGVLRGKGMMKPFMVATFTDLLLRVILAVVLATPLGPVGIWISWPIGWCVGTLISVVFYKIIGNR